MPRIRLLLFLVLGVLACTGAGLTLFASLGEAAVLGATAGVHGALERAGQHENLALRNDLYGVVMQLQGPWAIVQAAGLVVLVASAAGLILVWRTRL